MLRRKKCVETKFGFSDELDPARLHPVHINPLPDDEGVRVLQIIIVIMMEILLSCKDGNYPPMTICY